eukprot:CAMPEP_0180117198 /NCGR_PEP_ID=MMETSP0986-20121125/793_1 /TAXON_ID=697907 /ORGANISM="non described non described, Strain CCMP2293" /LENGTH=69 /DNA_ID=CAMNT_0022056061 /DNA_START=22 /DNA_END=231 /DNA_ORIENTATION=+
MLQTLRQHKGGGDGGFVSQIVGMHGWSGVNGAHNFNGMEAITPQKSHFTQKQWNACANHPLNPECVTFD